MSKSAFLFPGQGSQALGMMSELAAEAAVVRDTFADASQVLGYDLWAVTRDGPAERLNRTEVTQPAMLTAGVATWRAWQEMGGPDPDYVAGHSLGEYSALVAAGSLDFGDAVALAAERGREMQAAAPAGTCEMAAILGLDDSVLEEVCAQAAQGQVVSCANFNAPGQVVIAGNTAAVSRAIDLAKARGAKRAVTLPVSVPSHSRLMRSAAERLAECLATVDIRMPEVDSVYTVDVKTHASPDGIRQALKEQLFKPVRWADTVRAMIAAGVTTFVECGPGKVLTALNRRIERRPELAMLAVEDPQGLAAALDACREKNHA